MATFLRYFSPADILAAFHRELNNSSSILTKPAFMKVFQKAVIVLSKSEKLREGVEVVERDGFKNAVNWLFDVYTFGPDTRSNAARGPA